MSEQDDIRAQMEREMALASAKKSSEEGKKPGMTLEGAVRASVGTVAKGAIKGGTTIASGVIGGLSDAAKASSGPLADAATKFTHQADGKPNAFGKLWARLDPAAEWVIRFGVKNTPRLARGTAWTFNKMAVRQNAFGYRTFSAPFLLRNIIKLGIVGTAAWYGLPIAFFAAYFYGTTTTHKDVFVPVGGVYQNQQFVRASEAGKVIAPRDEIFTVLAQHKEPDGTLEPMRYDLDYNGYFAFPYDAASLVGLDIPYGDAARPDLAASKIQARSQYGAKCDLVSTGIYNRLPRYLRYRIIRWIDLRPEIVRVIKCDQLTAPFDVLPEVQKQIGKQGRLETTKYGMLTVRPKMALGNNPQLQFKAG